MALCPDGALGQARVSRNAGAGESGFPPICSTLALADGEPDLAGEPGDGGPSRDPISILTTSAFLKNWSVQPKGKLCLPIFALHKILHALRFDRSDYRC